MIYILIPISLILLAVGLFALYIVITEYKPAPLEVSEIIRNTREDKLDELKTITTFNLGYCSLDKEQDFFLEGGMNSRTISREKTFDNLISIEDYLKSLNSDFYTLQEVDIKGKRSANVNQVEHLASGLQKYNLSFAYNYIAKWVPLPFTHPMGSAYSGLLTLSKIPFSNSTRISLEGQETFPKSLFYPKRCMVINEVQINRNKKLFIINIHLSAYDKDGMYRSKQIAHILKYITNLYNNKENYIIVGGDFNLLLDKTKYNDEMPDWVSLLPKELYDSEFRVVFDKNTNTVRSQDRPYQEGINFETIIDGFIVSPNITVSKIETHNLRYENTDHNPVTLSFKLK
ncbi:hypothetical protein KQ51_01810 [Candidatus Izimaplasma bacterium HR1]|jgi:endonuclease/exonuclease/phosphatase family metal-dependent hydrolase|uniref:endonuclease/exonuclease/phosphatase family protein n=1 Tax=Candidatus Izimoplasma sp. HR1 TaxID=1541959 RepID=UPI0004F890C3|nr:hypothetical protein KQ51_01810 [Candidatus Izimaplasma bacterium HR1]